MRTELSLLERTPLVDAANAAICDLDAHIKDCESQIFVARTLTKEHEKKVAAWQETIKNYKDKKSDFHDILSKYGEDYDL